MSWKNIRAASLMALVGVSGSVVFAQDSRGQQALLEKDISTLNQQIASKQQQVKALRNRPSPEQAELANAQKALNDARADLKANPGAEAEGKARNAEFKFKLAEIKYDKSHAEVEALNDEVDRLKQQVASKQQQIKDTPKPSAEPSVDPQQQQKLADERAKRLQQEQELARSKQEADNAHKEIERLKAALASKEASEAKAAAAAPVPAVAAVAAAPVKAEPAKAEPVKASAAVASNNGASKMSKLDSQQTVLHALQNTAQRVAAASASPANRRTSDQSIYVKSPSATATNKDRVSLKGLGNNQYRGNNKFTAGEYEIVMGFNRWPLTLASSDAGELVFLLDASDEKSPHLVIYNSALEGS